MFRKKILVSTFSLLIISSCTYFAWVSLNNYIQLENENTELKILLHKLISAVHRDNNHIFHQLDDIVISTNYQNQKPERDREKIIINSLIKLSDVYDSSILAENLIPIARNEIGINDSLLHFAQRWSILTVTYDKYDGFGFLEHKPIYKYGDTIYLNHGINNPPFLLENNFDIIDYSWKKYGKLENNIIHYSIPRAEFLKRNEISKNVEFKSEISLKNNFTNKISTSYRLYNFIIER